MKKQSWFRRHWLLTIILTILVIWVVFSDLKYLDTNNEEISNLNVEEIILPEEASQETTEIKLSEGFERNFVWSYDGREWSMKMKLHDELYDLYSERSRQRDYDLFSSDPYDDKLIKELVDELTSLAKNYGLTNQDIPYFAVSFVQYLPYTSDDVTTGYDEYPRFPYETLYDNGGDCEDSSILVASLLQEMGYGVVLLEFPKHMAVGVKCTPSSGQTYYTYNGINYCYLETTGKNWDIGQIPEEYINEKAIIIPIYKKPVLKINFNGNQRYDNYNSYTDINITILNLGSSDAENVKIYIALQTRDVSKVWDSVTSDSFDISPESGYNYYVTNLNSPSGKDYRIYIRAYGDNVISDEVLSEWIIWE